LLLQLLPLPLPLTTVAAAADIAGKKSTGVSFQRYPLG